MFLLPDDIEISLLAVERVRMKRETVHTNKHSLGHTKTHAGRNPVHFRCAGNTFLVHLTNLPNDFQAEN